MSEEELDWNVFEVDHWNKDTNLLVLKRLWDYSDRDIKSLSSVSKTFRRHLLSQPSLWYRIPKKVNWNILPLIPLFPQSWYLLFNLIQDNYQYQNYEFVMKDHPYANLHTSFTSTFSLHHFLFFSELLFRSSEKWKSDYSGVEWVILFACYAYVMWRAVWKGGSDVMMTFVYLLCFLMVKVSALDVVLVGCYVMFMEEQIRSMEKGRKGSAVEGSALGVYGNLRRVNGLMGLMVSSGFVLHESWLNWMWWILIGTPWMKRKGSAREDSLVISFVLLGFVMVLLAYWVSYREVMVLESLGCWLRFFVFYTILNVLDRYIPKTKRESMFSSKGICFFVGMIIPLYYTCRLFSSIFLSRPIINHNYN